VEAGAGGLRIVAANGEAARFGVEPGLTLSDACARAPGLASAPIDRAGDRTALRQLAHWMGRYSPLVGLHGEDGLWMETTGCDHLFGGEAALLEEMSARLSSLGLTHRMGLAPTPGAAAALALAGAETLNCLDEDTLRAGLADLPVAALRLSGAAVQLLRRFGLTRIGQLYGIDRRALARPFASADSADAVVTRLDQALGLRAEVFDTLRPAPAYAEAWRDAIEGAELRIFPECGHSPQTEKPDDFLAGIDAITGRTAA